MCFNFELESVEINTVLKILFNPLTFTLSLHPQETKNINTILLLTKLYLMFDWWCKLLPSYHRLIYVSTKQSCIAVLKVGPTTLGEDGW